MSTSRNLFEVAASAAADYSTTGQYRCVALTTGTPPVATLVATAGAYAFGVLQSAPDAAGVGCTVRRLGTSKVEAGAAFAFGAQLTTDSVGRVVARTKNTQALVGEALAAASAAGEHPEVDLRPTIGDVATRKGTIQLPLAAARELSSNDTQNLAAHGGILASDSTPVLDAVNAGTDQQMQLTWAASNSDKIAWDFAWPEDLDPAEDVTFHCKALSGGATDTPTLTIEAFEGVGDTDFGGATGALGAALAEVTRTLAAADVGGGPNSVALTLTPGAHTTDTVVIQGSCWLEYTRK
jgi:hypothetical protein